jgi:FG-GAP-like repeat
MFKRPSAAQRRADVGSSRNQGSDGVCSVRKLVLFAIGLGGPIIAGAQVPTFAPFTSIPTGNFPSAVAIADLDGDGRNDIVMSTQANAYLFIFFQNADGTLAPPVRLDAGNGISVALGDVNGDGRIDIVTTYDDGFGVRLNLGNRNFGPAIRYVAPHASSFVTVVDLNGDGRNDVVAMDADSPFVTWFPGMADGTLGDGILISAPHNGFSDMKIGDVDGNGLPDIVVSSLQQPPVNDVVLVTQQTPGAFAPPRSIPYPAVFSIGPAGIALLDVDGDGSLDIVATRAFNNPDAALIALLNQNQTFTQTNIYPTYDIPTSAVVADFNLDGIPDVAVPHGGFNRVGVYTRIRAGGLAPEVLFEIPFADNYGPQGIAAGDIDGDGLPDIVIADSNNGLVILRNTTPHFVPAAFVIVPTLSNFALLIVSLLVCAGALLALRLRR